MPFIPATHRRNVYLQPSGTTKKVEQHYCFPEYATFAFHTYRVDCMASDSARTLHWLVGPISMPETMTALLMRLTTLACLSATLTLAGSWSGVRVDSKCWGHEERNVNPTDSLTYVDRDGNLEIRLCSPSPKTKSFAAVQQDGLSFNLDSAGCQSGRTRPENREEISLYRRHNWRDDQTHDQSGFDFDGAVRLARKRTA